MSRLLLTSVSFLLNLALVAQEPPKPLKGGEKGEQKGVLAEQKAEGVEIDGLAGSEGKQPPIANAMVYGARGYCRIDATVQPARLLPGQTGKAMVTMMFEGDAVMTAPANVEVAPMGGNLAFGSAVATPPERGRLAKAFLGQPVYDNWLVLEMPVTMSAQAPLGSKQSVAVGLTFELVSGTTAQKVGRFNDRALFNVEVGAAPDPSVAIPAAGSSGTSQPAPVVPDARDGGSNPRGTVGVGDTVRTPELEPAVGAKAPPEPPVAVPAAPEPRAEVSPRPEGSNNSLLIFGGGAVLLLILVAALMRRR